MLECVAAAVYGAAGIGIPGALYGDKDADPKPSVRKAGDGVWDGQAEQCGQADGRAGSQWPMPHGNGTA